MGLSSEQRRTVHEALQTADKYRASRKVKKALVEAGLVESNLRSLNYGDRDSQGFLQQRPSQGWGSPKQVRNVGYAAKQFVTRAQKVEGKYGNAGDLAQAVQRSAFPGRYNQRSGDAEAILKGHGGSSSSSGGSQAQTTPGTDRSQERRDIIRRYVLAQNGITAPGDTPDQFGTDRTTGLVNLALSLRAAKDTPATKTSSSANSGTGGIKVRGKVSVSPTADRPGAKLHGGVVKFVSKVAGGAGTPLTIGTGTRHNRLTVNGNVSDHWAGEAADVPASGEKLTRIGRAALIAAGMSPKQARQAKGGIYNVGHWQIIFNTHEGGDHTNHLHVGFSRNR